MINKFWMVWNVDKLSPTFKHSSILDAQAEAERLARSNPGKTFIVLEAKKKCVMMNPVQWNDFDSYPEPPF